MLFMMTNEHDLRDNAGDGVDRDQLIKELLAESFALRTKSEHLSQDVETQIAELVKTKLQAKLDSLISDHEHLEAVHVQMTNQRDRLRERMAQVDASPEYRLAKRLKGVFGLIFKDDTTK